jgi:hypothetical protein
MSNEIFQWEDISNHFNENLIVGNGGSIAIASHRFSYSSLYERAIQRGFINQKVQDVFNEFSKQYRDFEFVLSNLLIADHVNECLASNYNKRDNDVRRAYLDVRNSLIKTVRDLHPSTDETWSQVDNIGNFVSRFKNIFYLNYDLLLYWATLSQKLKSTHRFSDGFNALISDDALDKHMLWEFSSNSLKGGERPLSKIWYPHGSLMLYKTKLGNYERKISLPTANELRQLETFWRDSETVPLFICEGSTSEKVRRIRKSKYLSRVLNMSLPSIEKSLVIYGWSLSEQDQHIVEQLQKASIRKIAISIHKGDKDQPQLQEEIDKVHKKLIVLNNRAEIFFFDAQSAGCWCH